MEAYARAQGLFFEKGAADPVYSETIDFNLDAIEPSLAGPKRPQDRVPLKSREAGVCAGASGNDDRQEGRRRRRNGRRRAAAGGCRARVGRDCGHHELHQHVESERHDRGRPRRAGRLSRRGSSSKPWVKTSLAPGSKVVTDYLKQSGLDAYLDQLGFNLVGYGCTTCIGNSGPLPEDVVGRHRRRQVWSSRRC